MAFYCTAAQHSDRHAHGRWQRGLLTCVVLASKQRDVALPLCALEGVEAPQLQVTLTRHSLDIHRSTCGSAQQHLDNR